MIKLRKSWGHTSLCTYVVKATAKTELTELETEKEVDLADEQSEKVKVDLSLEGKYVSISSDESDATVFVNGKNVEN